MTKSMAVAPSKNSVMYHSFVHYGQRELTHYQGFTLIQTESLVLHKYFFLIFSICQHLLRKKSFWTGLLEQNSDGINFGEGSK